MLQIRNIINEMVCKTVGQIWMFNFMQTESEEKLVFII